MELSDLRGPVQFNPEGDAGSVASRWEAWLEEFEAFADCKGLLNTTSNSVEDRKARTQRRALLLYCAGPRVRSTFKTLTDVGAADDYDKCVEALNKVYLVKKNVTFQRHLFRKTMQQPGSTVAQFVTALRKAAEGCEYQNADEQIRDHVIEHCRSNALKKNFLNKAMT